MASASVAAPHMAAVPVAAAPPLFAVPVTASPVIAPLVAALPVAATPSCLLLLRLFIRAKRRSYILYFFYIQRRLKKILHPINRHP
jgi:hypothetical protein